VAERPESVGSGWAPAESLGSGRAQADAWFVPGVKAQGSPANVRLDLQRRLA
jgi:hypothetical protein